jgi:hypothetical protein
VAFYKAPLKIESFVALSKEILKITIFSGTFQGATENLIFFL